jgi:hypothetical protein
MALVYVTLGWILSVGFWARPLIDNATMSLGELLRSLSRRRAVAAAPQEGAAP